MTNLIKGILRFSGGVTFFFLLSGCATSEPVKAKKEYTSTERARMLVEVANGALVEGDPTGALQSLRLAEGLDSGLPELHHSKGLAFLAKHDLTSAIKSVKTALELKPDYADANNTLGKLLIDSEKYSDAEPYLMTAAKDPLYREAYKAWTNLGIIKYRVGQLAAAEKFFNQANESSPGPSCVAYYYKGHIGMKKANLGEAIENYKLATKKLCAHFGDAQLALGMAYQQDRKYELARKTYVEIQKRFANTKLAERAMEQLKFLP